MKNSPDADARPFSAHTNTTSNDMGGLESRSEESVIETMSLPADTTGRLCEHYGAAGRSFFTSSGPGSTSLPSTYLKSDIVPLPSFSAILPT